ncbi:unnamed protein product, partial [Phaeothamnion confervicola]
TQSRHELQHGFALSEAAPLVGGAEELWHMTDATGLYLRMLDEIRDPRLCLLDDNAAALTGYVAHRAVFFERHWAKLVKDIARGRLDRRLPVSPRRRRRIEERMLPDPATAKALDRAFAALGFHARSSGRFGSAAATAAAVAHGSGGSAAAASSKAAGGAAPTNAAVAGAGAGS